MYRNKTPLQCRQGSANGIGDRIQAVKQVPNQNQKICYEKYADKLKCTTPISSMTNHMFSIRHKSIIARSPREAEPFPTLARLSVDPGVRTAHRRVVVVRQLDAIRVTGSVAGTKAVLAVKFGPTAASGPFLGGLLQWVGIAAPALGLLDDLGGVLLELTFFFLQEKFVFLVDLQFLFPFFHYTLFPSHLKRERAMSIVNERKKNRWIITVYASWLFGVKRIRNRCLFVWMHITWFPSGQYVGLARYRR